MNNTITLTKEQMVQLQSGKLIIIGPPNPAQWEPAEGKHYISTGGGVGIETTTKSYAGFGMIRNTRDKALKAVDPMRTHNRLLAYVDEFDSEYVPDWENLFEFKHYIRYDHHTHNWLYSSNCIRRIIGAVYMSKECAQELIVKLNSGEVVL